MQSFSAKIFKIGINPYVLIPVAVINPLFKQVEKDITDGASLTFTNVHRSGVPVNGFCWLTPGSPYYEVLVFISQRCFKTERHSQYDL